MIEANNNQIGVVQVGRKEGSKILLILCGSPGQHKVLHE